MKQNLIIAALVIALLGSVFTAGRFSGISSCTDKKSTQTVKEVTNEAKRYANRPRTDDDVTRRLCDWIKRQESKDRTKRQLPAKPCN